MKRGFAVAAVAALAVAGAPFLASSASAIPNEDFPAPGQVYLYTPHGPVGVSTKDDGQNTTVSLVAAGGTSVPNILFQSSVDNGATWQDIGSPVTRNADGVFETEWASPPTTLTNVRAVAGGTGVNYAVGVTYVPAATANTVELSSEGSLGVFQAPYAGESHTGDYIGVRGTASDGAPTVTAYDQNQGIAFATATLDNPGPGADHFNAVLDYSAYPYSAGSEPNQTVIRAFTDNTDDAEASTLYVQSIGSITATPATVEVSNNAATSTVLTVKDTTGKPVAGAQVGQYDDMGTPAPGDDVSTLMGYTDGNGEIVAHVAAPSAGTYTYYVNTTDANAYDSTVDKAATFTVTSYTPTLDKVEIVNNSGRTNVDIDELMDGNDFTVVTLDQRGNPIDENLVGNDVEYRWTFGGTVTPWFGGETNAQGEFDVPAPTDAMVPGGLPQGSYTLDARRPNVNGVGLTNATPETFAATESEISYADGGSANAPINASYTVKANLANAGGGLGGREIHLTYAPGIDSAFAPQADQPAGVTVLDPTHATALTAANGDFSVVLKDPTVPQNVTPVPETGVLNALAYEAPNDATVLLNNLGPDDSVVPNDPANAEQNLSVHFTTTPDVSGIVVDTQSLYGADGVAFGPGRPADLDIVVTGKDGDTNPNNDPALEDFPVTVSVDKGFLSPNAENVNDLTLADGHTTAGSLWGFFKNLGTTVNLSTGDAAQAGVVAAIERDAGFDADGLDQMVVTVKAGTVTKTVTVNLDARAPINTPAISLARAAGMPTGDVMLGTHLKFNLWAKDQYGNTVGDQWARISDDSTVADFTTDGSFGVTLSDFTTSTPGIIASSAHPATQVLMAEMDQQLTVVNGSGDPSASSPTTMTASAPIHWIAKPGIGLVLKGVDNGKANDVITADAKSIAAGAVVKIYKVMGDGTKVLLKTSTLNEWGNHKFTVTDKNGNSPTKYFVKVFPTPTTKAGSGYKTVR